MEKPDNAVAGLAEVLEALGEELRKANRVIGERSWGPDPGSREPVLMFNGATVRMTTAVTRSARGGMDVWVLSGAGSTETATTVDIEIFMNGPEGQLAVGA